MVRISTVYQRDFKLKDDKMNRGKKEKKKQRSGKSTARYRQTGPFRSRTSLPVQTWAAG